MSQKLVLYGTELSSPVRGVRLALAALQLDYEFRVFNLLAGEHLQPEFLRKNPQHTVPALEDGEHMIVDSHAIMAYLVRKYGKDDALYPKDFYQRALVDQRLHYDTGVLSYTCLKPITRPLLYNNVTDIPQERYDQIPVAYATLEKFLDTELYMAGAALTIADFSIVATLSTLHSALVPIDGGKYPKLSDWLVRMMALPYYDEVNGKAAQRYAELVRSKLAQAGKRVEDCSK